MSGGWSASGSGKSVLAYYTYLHPEIRLQRLGLSLPDADGQLVHHGEENVVIAVVAPPWSVMHSAGSSSGFDTYPTGDNLTHPLGQISTPIFSRQWGVSNLPVK